MWYEIPSTVKPRLHGVVPLMVLSYPLRGTSWETPLLDPQGVLLSMSAEQIVSKWSFRLVGNTPFGPSPDGGPEMGWWST